MIPEASALPKVLCARCVSVCVGQQGEWIPGVLFSSVMCGEKPPWIMAEKGQACSLFIGKM